MAACNKTHTMRRHREEPEAAEGPSRTQLKNAMLELQDLGEALLQLPDPQLDQLITDEGPLREALRDMRRFTSHGARRRQISYIGKLLRDVDTAPLRDAVANLNVLKAREIRALREIEQWREKMIGSEAGWTEWTQRHPAGDNPQLRTLVREARRDREMAEVTGASGNGPAFREMFRLIRDVLLAA